MKPGPIRFRCPHCGQKTIGVWEKLKANGFRPRQCPACGGKHVPAAWPSILALALFLGGLVAPFLIAGSATPVGAVFLLLAGLALGFLGVTATYILCPLLRHGSRVARWESGSFYAALAALVLYALLKPQAPEPSAREFTALDKPLFSLKSPAPPQAPPQYRGFIAKHFGDAEMQARYKAALEKAQVPFTLYTEGGKEFVRVPGDYAATAARVERELSGK